jgi:hypothetical protein
VKTRWFIAGIMTVLAVAAAGNAVLTLRPRPISLKGAVLLSHTDPMEESPIAGVSVSVSDELAETTATSDFSGYFSLPLRQTVVPGQVVTLQFRHPDYKPLDAEVTAGDELYIARLSVSRLPARPSAVRPEIMLSHVVVRYTVEARVTTNVGSGVKTFEVVNSGNLPCEKGSRCSPDGKWKATLGTVSLDAGPENEFRNARLSCIAGPCPFTRIQSDGFSRGGRVISADVLNWSDTTTFTLEAEVVRPQLTNTIQRSYPIILGRRMNFTIPASAEGASIDAEVNGEQIVFPLGPTALLSWANCDVRTEKDQTKMYRCELKPGYGFKDRGGE